VVVEYRRKVCGELTSDEGRRELCTKSCEQLINKKKSSCRSLRQPWLEKIAVQGSGFTRVSSRVT